MGEEKRRYVRWKDKIQVAYASGGEGKQHYKEVFTEDVSELGVLISTFEELRVGEKVRLRLEFVYDSVPIMVEAKVAHVKISDDHYKIGLELVEMDDFQKQRLLLYLEMIKKEYIWGAE